MTFLGFSGLLNFICCLAIGVFIFLKDKKSHLNRIFSLFSLSICWYSLGYFLWQVAKTYSTAVFCFKFLFVGIILINALFLHCTLLFLGLVQRKKHILLISYITSLVFIWLNVTNQVYTELVPRHNLGLWPVPTIYFHFYLVFWFLQVFYCFFTLWKSLNTSTDEKKLEIKLFIIAFGLGYFGGATNWFMWYSIYLPPYLNILISIYAILFAYAIFKYQVLGITVAVRKSLVYSLFIALLFIVSIVALFSLERLCHQFFPEEKFWSTVLLLIILSILFQPLYFWSSTYIDKWFFKGTLPQISKEKEQIAEELQRSEKLAALGVIASGLAHKLGTAKYQP